MLFQKITIMPRSRHQSVNPSCCSRIEQPSSRREFLFRAGGGFGALALTSLLAKNGYSVDGSVAQYKNPLAARLPPLAAKARSVIFCFMDGGPSHIDLFDPKPELKKYEGKPLPDSFVRPMTAMGVTAHSPLLASKRTFRQYGESGHWVCDWLPEIASCADDLCLLQSVTADGQTHVAGVTQMNTGEILPGRPSLGSWVLYGLGSESDNLPGFVVLNDDATNDPPGGKSNWDTGFIPATFAGTKLAPGKSPILDVASAFPVSDKRQRGKIDFIQQLNQRHRSSRTEDDRLDARIASYELAFRMQTAAPEAVDLANETAATQQLYGMDREETIVNGRNCLLARRLVERGVRFVQLYMGAGSGWDAHADLEENHAEYCRQSDKPIAGLLKDLKRRGLLDSTLVIWGGEFGRTPMSESGNGRDHNPFGFTMWMAGGGVRPGIRYGATDEIGLYAVEKKCHVHDIHATVLHLLGLDHEQLTYFHNGRDERITGVSGSVLGEVINV